MRPRRRRAAALIVTLALIVLVGLWGNIWIRSFGEQRRLAREAVEFDRALDLAESGLALGRARLEREQPLPIKAWRGLGGQVRILSRPAENELRLTAVVTLDGPVHLRRLRLVERYRIEQTRWVLLERRLTTERAR